ncbi:MAG: RNA 2',3'-cyclic phosphodiesterase [Desulfurococcales archaeon]|nr:RNA 2',3'-cyclic phosphodiesterase [Desulfurococcales archaeon]
MVNLVRTFIAIDIDDDNVRNELAKVRDYLSSTKAELKPVATENIHITLRFIGEMPLTLVSELCDKLSKEVTFKPFKIKVYGLGVFPNIHRPRVIWAGITEGASNIIELHDIVEKILRKLRIPPSREKFIPHITIARVKSSRNLPALRKAIELYIDKDFGGFIVNSIKVKRSILTPRGPIYSDICVIKAVE